MVTHHIGHVLDGNLAGRLHKERHFALEVISHRIVEPLACGAGNLLAGLVHIGEDAVAQDVEGGPGAGVAAAHGAKVKRAVSVAEREFLILAAEISLLAGEGDHVRGVEAVLRIVQGEPCDAGLVCVGADVSVRDAPCHPDNALLLRALANQVHYPGLRAVGNGETLPF